ncbi:hypothetical protein ARMGADRAFT_569127 [Armillaria gallica]|uniref:Secreted protein n=1 Tax=Armillaria gallica TaxID=47427 RepID=A0A2H3DVS3_ARMGA|nr:hypothetical protein ARMGADRAFT_569127 [Armillaria gallica]
MATRTGWRALLSTLGLSKARLSRAVQPACPSDIVMCPLFMPLSPFRDSCPIFSPRCSQNDQISSCRFRYGKVYWGMSHCSSCSWTSRYTSDNGASCHRHDTALQFFAEELFFRRHFDRYSQMILSKVRRDKCSSSPPSSPFLSVHQ